jgi:hypothetical protein
MLCIHGYVTSAYGVRWLEAVSTKRHTRLAQLSNQQAALLLKVCLSVFEFAVCVLALSSLKDALDPETGNMCIRPRELILFHVHARAALQAHVARNAFNNSRLPC